MTQSPPGTTAPADQPENERAATPPVAAKDSASSIPQGIRTASEWSWRMLLIAAAAAAAAAALAALSPVTIPIAVAILLAALLQPITNFFAKKMPRPAAAGMTIVSLLVGLTGILSFVGSQFTSQFGDIADQVTQGIDDIRGWFRSQFGITDTQVEQWILQAREQIAQGTSGIGETAAQAGLTVTHTVAGFFIALFALFFFLYEGQRIWAWVVRLFPRAAREQVHTSGLIAWGQLSAFTRATILVAAADAIGIGAVAAILGVPFATGIAVLVFFGAFVPVIGATISGGVAVLLALVALGPVQALLMLGGVIAVQQIESHILQPILLGRAVRVHPLAVILSIAAGVYLAGIIGALLAVPTIAVLNAVGHHLLDGRDSVDSAQALLSAEQLARADEAVKHDAALDAHATETDRPVRD